MEGLALNLVMISQQQKMKRFFFLPVFFRHDLKNTSPFSFDETDPNFVMVRNTILVTTIDLKAGEGERCFISHESSTSKGMRYIHLRQLAWNLRVAP